MTLTDAPFHLAPLGRRSSHHFDGTYLYIHPTQEGKPVSVITLTDVLRLVAPKGRYSSEGR